MPMKTAALIWFVLAVLLIPSPGWSGQADVVDVTVQQTAEGTFSFAVTVAHSDTGWDHYADKWEIRGPGDTVLGTRVLYHPHVDEQPFTRSLSGVKIASRIRKVTIHAHDSVHGWGGKTHIVILPHAN